METATCANLLSGKAATVCILCMALVPCLAGRQLAPFSAPSLQDMPTFGVRSEMQINSNINVFNSEF